MGLSRVRDVLTYRRDVVKLRGVPRVNIAPRGFSRDRDSPSHQALPLMHSI